MTPLTHELLRERISQIFDRVLAAHGPVELIEWETVVCDRCGYRHNLTHGVPVGWTTSGDFEHGFTDLCRACSG